VGKPKLNLLEDGENDFQQLKLKGLWQKQKKYLKEWAFVVKEAKVRRQQQSHTVSKQDNKFHTPVQPTKKERGLHIQIPYSH
jgi:hypothetical protein